MASFNGNIGTPSDAFNLKVEYTYTQSISGNYTDITATGYVKRNRSSVNPFNSSSSSTLTVDGESASYTGSYDLRSDGYKQIVSKSKRVYHNADGTKSISISFSFDGKLSSYYPNGSISQTITLPTIPRYATITNFTVSKVDETSVKYSWNVDATCDWAKYSTDNGSTWNNLPTNNIVSGLSANTTYNFKLQLRRQDSQLWTTSNTVQQTTYAYPYCLTASNFTIGEDATFTFYNPLNRTIQIQMWSYTSQDFVSDLITITGTTYTGFSEFANRLYASIPNSKSSQYSFDVHYGTNKSIKPYAGTYTINESECLPTFKNFEYEDVNSNILQLTDDDQILVDTKSNCLFTISTSNKATAKNSATITKYRCQWGNVTNDVNENVGSDVTQQCDYGSGNIIKITAFDSRGLSTTVSKTITNIPYTDAFINNVSTQRKDGVDSKTYLIGKFTIFNGSWNASSNTDYDNRLKYVGYSVYSSGSWSNYYDITNTVLNAATVTTDTNTISYEFDYDDNIQIHANGSSGGFPLGTEYQIKVLIKDGNNSYTFTPSNYEAIYNTNVDDGTVATCLHKDSNGKYHFGFNCLSDDNYMIVVNDIPIIDNDGNIVSENYSTTEHKTNRKWIDGKPIYEISIQFGSGYTSSYVKIINITSLNIDTFIKGYGYADMNVTSSAEKIQPIPRVVPDNIAGFGIGIGDIDLESATKQLAIQFGNLYYSQNGGYLTIEYTKTTD